MPKDFTRYWLSLVREYTDDAVNKSDAGMDQDAIPPRDRAALLKRRMATVNKKKRVIITPEGRKFLEEKK